MSIFAAKHYVIRFEFMINKSLFSSKSVEWSTPQDLFDSLNAEFHFTLDPCASVFNHKCQRYFTISDDGLSCDWSGNIVFCNPPYGRALSRWVQKCYLESLKPGTICVMLIPARTDTSYFHDFIYHKAFEIRFLRGRLHFNSSASPAPFPSMVVVFKS